jgi:hypothetical protein
MNTSINSRCETGSRREGRGLVLGNRGKLIDLTEIGQHRVAERRQFRAALISAEQASAELVFQALDRVGQRRLGDSAAPGRTGEVAFFAEREEITDLMHFHEPLRNSADRKFFLDDRPTVRLENCKKPEIANSRAAKCGGFRRLGRTPAVGNARKQTYR